MNTVACPRCLEPLTEDEDFYGPCYSCRAELRDSAHVPAPTPAPEPEPPVETVEELTARVVGETPVDGPTCALCSKPVDARLGRLMHPCCESWAARGSVRCPACAESERAAKPRAKSTGPAAARKQTLPACNVCGGALQFGQPGAHFACHPDPTTVLAAHGGKAPDPCKACGRTSHHPCPVCREPLEHPEIHPDGIPTDDEWRGLARMAHSKVAAGVPLPDVEAEALSRFPGPPDLLCRRCLAYRPAGHACRPTIARSFASGVPAMGAPHAPDPANALADSETDSKNVLQIVQGATP